MKKITIGKVVVNISVGQSGQPLSNAMNILQQVTGQKPNPRIAKQTIRQWGIRKGEPMACTVTLRGNKAEMFLLKAFTAIRHRLNPRSFDKDGNFAFGIKEHIDIPGTRYDPQTGIIGMDVMATNPLVVVADDFECAQTGSITEIHIWGSFLNDNIQYPEMVTFTLSIHANIPANPPSIQYSRPGELLWTKYYNHEDYAWYEWDEFASGITDG